ncbi:MAG: ABC transporter permease [Thiohalocapsa sp.]|uniref:ABC transporter permease n=1 Tax=Thiohalocapsa sp. TaxID=2497641 RepID=UPI0025CF2070|nr:ABC transporter permease [Thiohalocapsa sp.]MCG6943361.1 ABC transporter permease [Thiohalocapsa sp.]
MPVILATDGLIFLLIVVALGYGVYASQHEHLRAPWRSVARSRVGMAALVVIGCYVLIGLLDSLHFHPRIEPVVAAEQAPTSPAEAAARSGKDGQGEAESPIQARYSTQVLSVLDVILTGLRERQEKTFSAPFAVHSFVKEPIERPDGSIVRDYPRLQYGGAHLKDPSQRGLDIAVRTLLGVIRGLAVWGLLMAGLIWLVAHARGEAFDAGAEAIWQGRTEVPWRVGLLALGLLLVLGFAAAELAGAYHILGTDKVGEDVFYQSLKSIRTGLVIGTLTTLVMLPAAVILGIMAGYFRGLTDDVIQYLYTTLNSIPGVLLIAAAILMLQVYMTNHAEQFESLVQRADLRLLFLCIILGVTSWTGLCRLLRGESLKLREQDYVQAATALGVRHATIIARHILPNVLHIVMITVVLDFSGLVLAEAVLSYVNIGVDPTMNSWGNMINSARLELAREPIVWWSLAAAFAFMFTLVLAANLFADVVRDAFDPRLARLK